MGNIEKLFFLIYRALTIDIFILNWSEKKGFQNIQSCGIIAEVMQSEGGNDNETYQNIEYTDIKQYSEKRRMWRMSDIMPVSM